MEYVPFENWVTVVQAPDLHQDVSHIVGPNGQGMTKPVSYSRRKLPPDTGRWFRVVAVGDEVPPYMGEGAPVLCNMSMMSDRMTLGGETVDTFSYTQIAAIRISPELMREKGLRHPLLPIGDYVLCVDNDDKHTAILRRSADSLLHIHPMTLERGQRTDEQYENTNEDEFDEQNPNRPNDGVKVMFTEVLLAGPEVPEGRLSPGDMAAFRPNVCGIKLDLFGVSYRLVRCGKKNSEIMGKVPARVFEAGPSDQAS